MLIDRLVENITRTKNEDYTILLQTLKESQCFIIDNVAESWWLSNQRDWDMEKDFPNIAPQYPVMWFEYSGSYCLFTKT